MCRHVAPVGHISRHVAPLGHISRHVAPLGHISRHVAPLGHIILILSQPVFASTFIVVCLEGHIRQA